MCCTFKLKQCMNCCGFCDPINGECPRPEYDSDPLLGYALLAEPHESAAK